MQAPEPKGDSGSRNPLVVLLNFGGPRHLDEVEDFLFEILRDPNTIQLPLPQTLQDRIARRVARRRAPEIRRQYGEIGGRSPIVEDTERIAAALTAALRAEGIALPLRIAQRYLPGWTEALAQEIVEADHDRIFAVPLYPHFSHATTGSSIEQFAQALDRAGFRGELRCLRSYPAEPGYLDALEGTLRPVLSGLNPAETVILCSAHGLPRRYVERGDPYRLELYQTVERLRERFAGWRVDLAFQSRVGPLEWLRPYTDEYVPVLAEQGVRDLVFVPISFVNDHIETLYEIGVTYFDLARKHGMRPHRAAAVSAHPGHVAALAGAVKRWHAGWSGVPYRELLPPDQSFARRGAWLWLGWGAALLAAFGYAVAVT